MPCRSVFVLGGGGGVRYNNEKLDLSIESPCKAASRNDNLQNMY